MALFAAMWSLPQRQKVAGPVVRVGDDGLTRERDEHCHDLSAWD